MKNKNNKVLFIYIFTSLLLVLIFNAILLKYTINPILILVKDILFVLVIALITKIILTNKEIRYNKIFKRLIDTNTKIKEINELNDIVSKATSDIIRDWRIQEDNIIWSKGVLDVFGFNENQIGNNCSWWFENIHPEDSIKMSIRLYSLLEQKTERWQDQYRFKCSDGTYKFVLDRGYIMKDKNGKSIRMIAAIQDITKQKEEEQRLKLLETVITNTRNSIIITEPKSFEGNIPKIVYANPAFFNMTGYSTDQIIGKSPSLFNGPNSDDKEYKKLITAIESEKECEVETISYNKNKESYWVNFSMIPVINTDEELTHWISIQRDITVEKKQEVEKEQLISELTRNNKDLKQFSYITSHNLRAPLSNLTGLLNLLEDIQIEDPELKEILDGFNKSTHHLNETISDLVKVVVIKDNLSIQKEDVNLNDIFENVFSQLDFLIGIHKPILKINFEKAAIINTNKAYLESILLNLLTNSLKYKSDKHPLKINISTKKDGEDTVLTFQDNGIGIDLVRNGEKIFGLYQRFHTHVEGKGLGLYLVRSQVETMGGKIFVDSEVDKGTTYTITFNNK
ncbi:PAS domain-containing protein [Flavobacterium sp.]|uniref:PAS domain-containing sensor histidine kinase n=1 Tax=Flavobacterium sp. TaxID=239 RepID=UPI0038FCB177